MAFTPDQVARYARHLILPEVGGAGQRKLLSSSVLLLGAGGLGSPASMYLAAAGVGKIGIVDFDNVDASNLQRQLLHGTDDIGRPKVESAADTLRNLNPDVEVVPINEHLNSDTAMRIFAPYDIIVDGTDNFPTRYLANDAAHFLAKPLVHGSIFRFEGRLALFDSAKGTGCYRCLFPEPPPPGSTQSCAEAGVLGVVPGLVGTIQATEAIKQLLGLGDTLVGRLLTIDVMTMAFRTMEIRRDPECPACGTRALTELIDYDEFCGGATTGELAGRSVREILPSQLAQRLEGGENLEIIDVREPYEWQIGHIPGARLVPLDRIAAEIPQLDKRKETILYCKVGERSMYAARQLADAGVSEVRNLAGGILRWIDEVDPSMTRY